MKCRLFYYGNIKPQYQAVGGIAEMVLIAKKRDVVALLGKIAFIAGINRNTAEGNVQTRLVAPFHLFEPGFVAIYIGQF